MKERVAAGRMSIVNHDAAYEEPNPSGPIEREMEEKEILSRQDVAESLHKSDSPPVNNQCTI